MIQVTLEQNAATFRGIGDDYDFATDELAETLDLEAYEFEEFKGDKDSFASMNVYGIVIFEDHRAAKYAKADAIAVQGVEIHGITWGEPCRTCGDGTVELQGFYVTYISNATGERVPMRSICHQDIYTT